MECKKEQNTATCTCSYESCERRGVCCECISHHWNMKQLPGCLFPTDVEKTYDRSLKRFLEVYQ